jgi:hypothetical protein
MHTFCTLFAHFLQQMIQTLQTSCTLILYLQTFCRTFAHFLQIICFQFAGFMHTYFRPDADLMQIELMHCRILADSMHTLRRANQCHYNAAARPRGASGEGGTLCDALLLPQEGEAAAREGEAEARDGEAAAREGEAVAASAYFALPGDAVAADPCFAGEAEAREDKVVARAGEAGGACSRDSAAAADPTRFAGEEAAAAAGLAAVGGAAAAAAATGLAASAGPRIRSIRSFPPDLLAPRTPVAGGGLVTSSSQSCSNSSMLSLCCRSEYARKA